MGVSNLVTPSASTLKTLGLSITSTNASITSLPTNKSITAIIIGGGGSAAGIVNSGTIAGGGSNGGGSGQVREFTFALTSSVTASVTIGAGGAGVATTTSDGNNGGNTTLTIPNIIKITALGGQGSTSTQNISGSGGGSGGFGGGGGNTNGIEGGTGALLGMKNYETRGSTSTNGYIGASQNITEQFWTFPVSSVTNNSSSITLASWVAPQFNLIPGTTVSFANDYGSGSTTEPLLVSTSIGSVRNSAIILNGNYTGSTTTTPQIGYATQSAFSVLNETYDLLTRANIRIPGGGGGGGGGNYTTGTARAGGLGAGTGGNGGSGGYSDQANNNIRATHGTAGAQPGGGGGGTGGYGYQGLSGPASGNTAAGGDGAVYFFWVA